MKNKLLVIVPCFNEENNIVSLVQKLHKEVNSFADILYINDGSIDSTRSKLKLMKVNYLDLPFQHGLSSALRAGFLYAREHNYSHCVQFDADFQHDMKDIKKLYRYSVENKNVDLVIASRYLMIQNKRKIKKMAHLGNRYLSFLIFLLTHVKLTDSTSGFRLYNKRLIEKYVDNNNLNFEPDSLHLIIKNKYKIKEMPTTYLLRKEGRSYFSFLNILIYIFEQTCAILFINWFKKLR